MFDETNFKKNYRKFYEIIRERVINEKVNEIKRFSPCPHFTYQNSMKTNCEFSDYSCAVVYDFFCSHLFDWIWLAA